ncbi:hypothetical protein [Thiomicrospira sp. XS5]|jgi:PBP1b-binding outer membrane lipoprotein LpoB|uniref:hypothetical protein n=1 Tax=Thiomicrospira sp. XS5 TaxID=1775636 RepID=UPI000A84C1E2|nr:hypothetical protein [Thiomicrospira sp. XS5]
MKLAWLSLVLGAMFVLNGCSTAEERAYQKEYQKEAAKESHQELSREAEKVKE